jgi:transposase
MAIVQLRHDTERRRYYDRKKAAGKSSTEALRCLERRLSDAVYRQMFADAQRQSPPAEPPVDAGRAAVAPTRQVGARRCAPHCSTR